MLTHLLELRRRTLHTLCFFSVTFLILFFYSDELFHIFMRPLLSVIPHQDGLIATHLTSPLVTPLKLAAHAALLLSTPFALYHFWCFISPGLYNYEKKQMGIALCLSILLFFLGLVFCFYLILPFMFHFIAQAVPAGVRYMPDIVYALDCITGMLLLFGLCFQVPLIMWLSVQFKLVHINTLTDIRPYVIVAAFIIGMLLTPPDVLSQLMLALPLWALYELGLLMIRVGLSHQKN